MSEGLFTTISMQSHRTRRFYHLIFSLILLVSLVTGPAPATRALPMWAASAVPISTRWIAARSLGTPRLGQTATLLTDGQIFVAGGVDDNGQVLATTEIYNPATGVWHTAAPMHRARWHHTATMLRNGLVLVAGGSQAAEPQDSSRALDTAEIYDPSGNYWTPLRRMSMPRVAHTATLLRDGTVLIVGGGGPAGPLDTAEIFDPIHLSWIPLQSKMSDARWYHTATLLPGSDDRPGKLLVVGGRSASGDAAFLASAEIYDSATKTWTPAGFLSIGRDRHSATLLADGTVLVVGGFNGAFLKSVDRYDPATNQWNAPADLALPDKRGDHIAALLSNGRLLIAGGRDDAGYPTAALVYDSDTRTWENAGALAGPGRTQLTATLMADGRVLLAGGGNGIARDAAELYDPSVGFWSAAARPAISRRDHSATLLSDRTILVAGGELTNGEAASSGEIYDPASGAWSTTGSLNNARFGHTATLLYNGKVLVVGGRDAARALASVEIYDPAAKTWTVAERMSVPRFGHSATLLANGKVLVAGGYDLAAHSPLASAEIYNPATGRWTDTSGMSKPRSFFSATLLPDSSVLAAGGGDGDGGALGVAYADAELYNPTSGTWVATQQPMSVPRWSHTATLLPNGKVLVVGGGNSDDSARYSSAELYDPATGAWSAAAAMSSGRRNHQAVLLSNGKVLIVGGLDQNPLASAELYDPPTGAWSTTDSLGVGRYANSLTLLPDGRVLALGGAGGSGALADPELYDAGVGFQAAWRPELTTINNKVPPGVGLYIGGLGFRGLSETSAGGVQSSPANYPIVQIRSLANEWMLYLTTNYNTSWSDTGVVTIGPYGFPSGYALATVVVNGMPSVSWIVKIGRDRYVARDDPASTDVDNDCLRQDLPCRTIGAAIDQAYDGDRISIGSGVYPETLHLSKSLILLGSRANATIIAGNGAPNTSIVSVTSGAAVQLYWITIQGGNAQEGGGVRNEGNLALGALVRDNHAIRGGGIYNAGILDFSGTISGNSATEGGGIYNIGQMSAALSTISGNSATEGGGILQAGSDSSSYLFLRNSTIANNTATSRGGGVVQRSGRVPLSNTILASNSGPGTSPDCAGALVSSGYNLLGNNAGCTFTAAEGDLIGAPEAPIDPLLGPLQDNGGQMPTHALLPGSPAIDAGSPALPGTGGNACATFDLHGVTRPQGGRCDIGAYELVRPTRYAAPDGDDGNDCQTSTAPCRTINEAIIKVPADGLVLAAAGTYTEAISIDKNLSLVGAGAGATIINDDPSRLDNSVVAVTGGVTSSSIFGVTIQNGVATPGGGIANSGALILDNVIVRGNQGGSNGGGGIYNYSSGTLTIRNHSIISGNHATPNRGGGIYNDAGGRVSIEQSTVSHNDAADSGGGIYNLGELKLSNSIISGNSATGDGGGIYIDKGGQAILENMTIRDNQSLATAGGIFVGHDATVQLTGGGILSNTSAGRGGGVRIADNAVVTLTDVVIDSNQSAAQAGGISIGASTAPTATVAINHAIIQNNRAIGYGGGIESEGKLTIAGSQIISNTTFSAGGGVDNIGALTITSSVISANRLENPTGDGIWGGAREWGGGIWSRSGSTLVISGTTISNHRVGGDPGYSDGGGLYLANMTAVLTNVVISDNEVLGNGGGISADGNTSLTITGSTISGNRAKLATCPPGNCNEGGGINVSGGGVFTIVNSTISNNHSDNIAGGIFWQGGVHTALDHVTVTSNTARQGGGIWRNDIETTLHVRGSIIAGNQSSSVSNTSDTDCQGGLISDGGNLFGIAGECDPTSDDLAGTEAQPLDPRLDPLGYNGGSTPTHALQPGSPAIDKAPSDACPVTDQRGVPRPYGPLCDIGAYELDTPLDSSLDLTKDVYNFENPAGIPKDQQLIDDFQYTVTTRLITETHVLSDISALDGLNLPIGLDALGIQAVLPLDVTRNLTQSGQLVFNPSAYLYLELVKKVYDDDNLRYYDGVIRSGLCAGMTATVGDFKSGVGPYEPNDFGGDGTVASLTLTNELREYIQKYQGRQLGAAVLNWLANQGTHDANGLYAYLAAKIGSPEWLRDPEIIGINGGTTCDGFEVGHALLPYHVETHNGHGLIYVYDPNYPPSSSQTANRAIDIDFAANTWTYQLSPKTTWTGSAIYSTPVRLFRERPTLPAMTNDGAVMVSGGQRGAWGGQRGAWGGQRGAWGEVTGTETRTGCYVSPDGKTLFVVDITGSVRAFPLTGPRIPDLSGGPIFPEMLYFPTGQDMTFFSAGGNASDLLIFGKQTVVGFLATAKDKTKDRLDVDKDFHKVTISTNETSSDKRLTLYQMHETATDNPNLSETRVYAVTNAALPIGATLTMSVSQSLQSVEIVNTGGAMIADIGFAGVGHSGVSSIVYARQPIGADERRVYTPSSWQDLAHASVTVAIYDASTGQSKGTVVVPPPAFPSASAKVRDRFDHANGALGKSWAGATGEDNYTIRDHQVRVRDGGPLYWQERRFGRAQEAFVTLQRVSSQSGEQGLLLKVQSHNGIADWKNGAIKVVYDAKAHEVRVATYQPGSGWQLAGRLSGVVFASGDQLGARVRRDGVVEVYRNGLLSGTASTQQTNGEFFARRDGRIGIWYTGARRAIFDNFGGGTTR